MLLEFPSKNLKKIKLIVVELPWFWCNITPIMHISANSSTLNNCKNIGKQQYYSCQC